MTTRVALPLLLALGLSAVPLAKSVELPSAWRTTDITVDGQDGEWPGGATLLAASPVAVGVANDGEFLYLRLRTSDRGMQTHLLFGGLTVWIDPGGREKKALGIKYPVGARLPEPGSRGGRGERPEGPSPGNRPTPTPGRGGRTAPPFDLAAIVPPRAELLGPGKDEARSLVLDHLPPGVAVAIARAEDALVYEVKIPLARSADHPFGLGIAPGTRIAIGLETGKLQRPEGPGRPGGMLGGGRPGGGPGGGMGGGSRGGPRGGGRDGTGRDGQATTRPLNAWVQVRLASAP